MTTRLGYKVWRTTHHNPSALQLKWGAPANKLEQYKAFKQMGLSSLEFTTDKAVAGLWLNNGLIVVGRKLMASYEGKGIVLFEPNVTPNAQEILECKVFTKYIPKKQEFRVHVFKNQVVSILEKRKKKDWTGPSNPLIRNSVNGYIFCFFGPSGGPLEISESVRERITVLALASRKVCSSDFCGVDIGYDPKTDNVFVIEVNSAPGIEGSNVKKYCDAIEAYVKASA